MREVVTERWNIVGEVIAFLRQLGVGVSIIHGWEHLGNEPYLDVHDIDLVVSAGKTVYVDEAVSRIGWKHGYRLVARNAHHVPGFVSYVLVKVVGENPVRLVLDVLGDRWEVNPFCIGYHGIVRGSPVSSGIDRGGRGVAVLYRLIKHMRSRSWEPAVLENLSKALASGGKEEALPLLDRVFGKVRARQLVDMIVKGQAAKFERESGRIYRWARIRLYATKPWLIGVRAFFNIRIIAGRVLRRSGIFLALLGADGAGKTTVGKLLERNLEIIGYKSRVFHWRPNILPNLGALWPGNYVCDDVSAAKRPHDKPLRGRVISFVKLAYYMVDFVVGGYFKVLPLTLSRRVVRIERYVYDFVVDCARYGMKVPSRIGEATIALVLQPDIAVLLDGCASTILARKAELHLSEMNRQIARYRKLALENENIRLINANCGEDEVALSVFSLVMEKLEVRAQRSLAEKREYEDSKALGYLCTLLTRLNRGKPLVSTEPVCSELPESRSRRRTKARAELLGERVSGCAASSYEGNDGLNAVEHVYRYISVNGHAFWIRTGKMTRLPYNPVTLRGRVLAHVIRVYACVADRMRIPGQKWRPDPNLFREIEKMFGCGASVSAINMGTNGFRCQRKMTLLVSNRVDVELGFVKVGCGERACGMVDRERWAISMLAGIMGMSGCVPRLIGHGSFDYGNWVAYSGAGSMQSGPRRFEEEHIIFLLELYHATRRYVVLEENPRWQDLLKIFARVEDRLLPHWRTVIRGCFERIQSCLSGRQRAYIVGHGDFVPWNTKIDSRNLLYVFDWESARVGVPPFHDMIYFELNMLWRKASVCSLLKRFSNGQTRKRLTRLADIFGWKSEIDAGVTFCLLDVLLDRIECCVEDGIVPEMDALTKWTSVLVEKYLSCQV